MNFWEELVQSKLIQLNSFEPKEAMFLRMFLQQAAEDKLDSQARLLIPKNLTEYAGINKEVLILGAIKKIEIWNPQNYEEYLKMKRTRPGRHRRPGIPAHPGERRCKVP